jgi:SNF2 family DNA or RNA helicase
MIRRLKDDVEFGHAQRQDVIQSLTPYLDLPIAKDVGEWICPRVILPPKLRRRLILRLPEEVLNHFQERLQHINTLRDTQFKLAQQQFNELYLTAAVYKEKAICEEIRKLCIGRMQTDKTAKVLIFTHQTFILDSIAEVIKSHNFKYIQISGVICKTKRAQYVEQFQTDPTIRFALLNIQAGGSGLTLTAGNIVYFAEYHMNPCMHLQAEDRIHGAGYNEVLNNLVF